MGTFLRNSVLIPMIIIKIRSFVVFYWNFTNFILHCTPPCTLTNCVYKHIFIVHIRFKITDMVNLIQLQKALKTAVWPQLLTVLFLSTMYCGRIVYKVSSKPLHKVKYDLTGTHTSQMSLRKFEKTSTMIDRTMCNDTDVHMPYTYLGCDKNEIKRLAENRVAEHTELTAGSR